MRKLEEEGRFPLYPPAELWVLNAASLSSVPTLQMFLCFLGYFWKGMASPTTCLHRGSSLALTSQYQSLLDFPSSLPPSLSHSFPPVFHPPLSRPCVAALIMVMFICCSAPTWIPLNLWHRNIFTFKVIYVNLYGLNSPL